MMTHDTRRRPENDDQTDAELPPLVEDDEAGDVSGSLESFIEDQRDDGMSWLDDRVGIDDYDASIIADEIGALDGVDEPDWLDGSEADDTLEGTESDIGAGEEYGWTNDSDVPTHDEWDDELDLVDESTPSILDDEGEEGVDDEALDIDMSAWGNLEETEGEGTEEEEFFVELEFGLSLEQERRAGGELMPPLLEESQLKAAWLGPPGAPAVSVAFGRTMLFAAGAGLFVPTENRLVATTSSSLVEEGQATTVAIDTSSTIFVGTLLSGVLATSDMGETVEQRNSWTEVIRGCGTPSAPSVPVKVGVSSQLSKDRQEGSSLLWVSTHNGHLLRSSDSGQSYETLLADARVMTFACDAEGPAVTALVRDQEGLAVYWSGDGHDFLRRPVPQVASALERALEPQIAVRGEAVLVGDEDLQEGALYWPSGAAEFHVLEECPRASVLAMWGDEASPTLLAGLFFAGRDMGTLVRKIGDGEWVRVCDIGRLEGLFTIDQTGVEDISTRIHGISVNPTSPRQIALATGHGVFVLEMKDA